MPSEKFLHFFHCVLIFSSQLYGGFFEKCFQLILGDTAQGFVPFSILNAFDSMAIRDYWFSTGTPTYLVRLLQHSREQINELAGRYYVPSLFVDYKADVEQPLPMIYQSGYLTIKE